MKINRIYKFRAMVCIMAALFSTLMLCLPAGATSLVEEFGVTNAQPWLVRIPVSQVVKAPATVGQTYQYTLTAKTPGAPMPEGASGELFVFTVKGTMEKTIEISFAKAAAKDYFYELKLTSNLPANTTAADSLYYIRIRAENGTDGMNASVYFYDVTGEKKVESLTFTIIYEAPPTEPPTEEPTTTPTTKPTDPTTGPTTKPTTKPSTNPNHPPKTGDETNFVGPVLLVIGCVMGLFVLYRTRRKEDGADESDTYEW